MTKAGERRRVLVVDDDAATRRAMAMGLELEGYVVETADSAEAALPVALRGGLAAVVTDLVMGGLSGLALLRRVKAARPWLPVVVITGYGSVASAVEAMREGAADYLVKPIQLEQLAHVLHRVTAVPPGGDAEDAAHGSAEVLGRSDAILRVLRVVGTVGGTDVTVLLRGESGTGKELVARAIHRASPRSERALVTVHCAAIVDSLAESELFGHEKGAFTGAVRQRAGRLEAAEGGTLFLDEVGDLSPGVQTKLLRVLQERTFERVGGSQPIRVDVRVVAATNRDLEAMVADGRFRQDLYYRLRVVEIVVPALRDRIEDIALLFEEFLARFARRHLDGIAPTLGRGVLDALRAHAWPGNVRELRNLAEQLVVTAGRTSGRIGLSDLPAHIRAAVAASAAAGEDDAADALLDGSRTLDEIERVAIQRALARTGGNKAEAARLLGIGLKTLYRKLKGE